MEKEFTAKCPDFNKNGFTEITCLQDIDFQNFLAIFLVHTESFKWRYLTVQFRN